MDNQVETIETIVYENKIMPTATYVRTLPILTTYDGNGRFVQELYKLSEPIKPRDYAPERHCYNCSCSQKTHDWVVVSAVDNQFAVETAIFPATPKYGEIENYTELPGSISRVFDIEAALRNAGYQVIR